MANRSILRVATGMVVAGSSLFLAPQALPQSTLRPAPPPRPAPRLEPVAETRLKQMIK